MGHVNRTTHSTSEGHNAEAFTRTDWILLLIPSALFGASFLLIARILDYMAPGAVTFGRIGFAYVAASVLAGRVGSTRSSVITYIAAPVAMILGIVIRGETVTPVQAIGGLLTLSGAWFASRAGLVEH